MKLYSGLAFAAALLAAAPQATSAGCTCRIKADVYENNKLVKTFPSMTTVEGPSSAPAYGVIGSVVDHGGMIRGLNFETIRRDHDALSAPGESSCDKTSYALHYEVTKPYYRYGQTGQLYSYYTRQQVKDGQIVNLMPEGKAVMKEVYSESDPAHSFALRVQAVDCTDSDSSVAGGSLRGVEAQLPVQKKKEKVAIEIPAKDEKGAIEIPVRDEKIDSSFKWDEESLAEVLNSIDLSASVDYSKYQRQGYGWGQNELELSHLAREKQIREDRAIAEGLAQAFQGVPISV